MKYPPRTRIFVFACFASIVLLSWNCEQKKTNPLDVQSEDAYATLSKQASIQKYDEAPEPIGGFTIIAQNLHYPEIAKRAGIQGRVILNVLVNKNGNVDSVNVLKSLGESGCDEAAIAAVQAVQWKPAKFQGQPVNVWVGIPVVFKLDGNTFIPAENAESKSEYRAFFEKLSSQAAYPASAKRAGIEAKVEVKVFIDKDGSVTTCEIAKESGFAEAGFDQAAVNLLNNKKWPVMKSKGEVAVSYLQFVEVEYKSAEVLVSPKALEILK